MELFDAMRIEMTAQPLIGLRRLTIFNFDKDF